MGEKIKKIKIEFSWQSTFLVFFWALYNIYLSSASILRYNNYYTGRFDLGNMAQTVWNTVHGNIFAMTDPNATREVSRLAFHADFILILISPLYLLWEDPRILLIFQTLIVSFGGIFVYLLSKDILKNKTISLILAFSFFINPAVNYANLYEFHSVTLCITFFLAAFYFIRKKNYFVATIFIFLAGISKEEVWAINFLIGLYLVFFRKQRLLGALISASSALMFYFLFFVAIPKALGGAHFAVDFYSDFGSTPAGIIKGMILHPGQVISLLFEPDRISILKQYFMPLGYLSVFGLPLLIFAVPDLGINLLSNYPPMHQIYYQYSATITPFVFLSAIYGIRFLNKKLPEISLTMVGVILIIMAVTSSYLFGPLPFAKRPNLDWVKKPLLAKQTVDGYISTISEEESISASNNLGSHLSHRRNIYVAPRGIDISDQVLILVSNKNEEKTKDNLLANPLFELILSEGNFYVFKKK